MDVAAMTLNAELDGWLALLRTRVQPTTHRSYDDMIHSELRPLLGECLVGELTVHQVDLHLVHLLQQGGRRGGPLTPETVHDAHAILRQALGEAVRDGLLADNVAERAATSARAVAPGVHPARRAAVAPKDDHRPVAPPEAPARAAQAHPAQPAPLPRAPGPHPCQTTHQRPARTP